MNGSIIASTGKSSKAIPKDGQTQSTSKKRKRSEANDEVSTAETAPSTTAAATPNLEDMRAARMAALQEQEKDRKLNPVVGTFVMPRRQTQKREPKPNKGKEPKEKRPKKPRREKEPLSAEEIKRQAAKELRNAQYRLFLTELETLDRNDPSIGNGEAYIARTAEREKEAHSRMNVVNTSGLKKAGKIKERAELLEKLADAGIGVWDDDKAEIQAKQEASERGLPETSERQKPPPTKAQIKKSRQKCHNSQHRVILQGLEKADKDLYGDDKAAYNAGAKQREAEAGKRVKLVNTPGIKQKALNRVREESLKMLATANVPVWYTSANQPEPVQSFQNGANGRFRGEDSGDSQDNAAGLAGINRGTNGKDNDADSASEAGSDPDAVEDSEDSDSR